jgi:CRP-like cAMP-binding protein
MDRERVAAILFDLLEPGGAFVHVNTVVASPPLPPALPFPSPPRSEIDTLVKSYLGDEQRAGQGVLGFGTPDNESAVLVEAGYRPANVVIVEGREVLQRSVDDIVAWVFSNSGSAPHLFGADLPQFERDLRQLLDPSVRSGSIL